MKDSNEDKKYTKTFTINTFSDYIFTKEIKTIIKNIKNLYYRNYLGSFKFGVKKN